MKFIVNGGPDGGYILEGFHGNLRVDKTTLRKLVGPEQWDRLLVWEAQVMKGTETKLVCVEVTEFKLTFVEG
jgi:hypothetical protein